MLYGVQKFLWSPIQDVSGDPLIRLGLHDPNTIGLKLVACTFSAYHNLKFTLAPRFHCGDLNHNTHMSLAEQSAALRSFAEVFRTEALELGCPAQCFDLAKFNSYLDGQSALDDTVAAALAQEPSVVQAPAGPSLPEG